MQPTVLLATTAQWFSTARLAMSMADAGWAVKAVCPSSHPLHKTASVRRIYAYSGLTPLSSLAQAINAAEPDIIIPGDDLATQQLHYLYDRESKAGNASTRALIVRSLGAPESFPVVYSRTAFLELAREEGVRVPRSQVITSIDELRALGSSIGFPMVLKANGTSGGEGVRIVHNAEEAKRAFRLLHAPPLVAKAAKWALIDGNSTLVWPSLLRRRAVVNAQSFVMGRESTSLVACWKGKVLAGLHFEVVVKQESAGPSTVVRLIEHPEMSSAAEKMVARLNLSGLHGFDFMLEAQTGNAHLIEINPRTTQVGHLALGAGRDLAAALYEAVSGNTMEPRKVTDKDTIALFPQEWLRDPRSDFLRLAHHDVPWDEPVLLRACVRRPRTWKFWAAKHKWLKGFSAAREPRP